MKIPGYSNWFTVFRPLRWLVPLAEQMYDVAGVFLAADTPLPDETVRLLQRIAGELGEIRDILSPPRPLKCEASLKGHPKCCTLALGHDTKHWNPYFGNWSADETSAPPVAHSRSPEDAAGGPPPIAPDSVSGGGHPQTSVATAAEERPAPGLPSATVSSVVGSLAGNSGLSTGAGQPNVEDIPDEYWDDVCGPFVERRAAENARLRRELDAARQERDNANARANAHRLAP